MMLKELITKCRSYRRFYEDHRIDEATLLDLVELARRSASGANKQPLKFILSCTREKNDLIFSCCQWAGYLTDWDGPVPGERPSAYIIILGDTQVSQGTGCDQGIAAQSMLLGAVEKGLGGCMIGSVKRDDLRKALAIPERYQVVLVVALGKPKEEVVLETTGPEGDIKYYRDANGVHHVPKRPLDDLIVG